MTSLGSPSTTPIACCAVLPAILRGVRNFGQPVDAGPSRRPSRGARWPSRPPRNYECHESRHHFPRPRAPARASLRAFALGSLAKAQAQLPLKLDHVQGPSTGAASCLGSAATPSGVPADFVGLPPCLEWGGSLPYGWDLASGAMVQGDTRVTASHGLDFAYPRTGAFGYEDEVTGLIAEGHDAPSGAVFRVDTGPGLFLVRISLGKADSWVKSGPVVEMDGVFVVDHNNPAQPIMQEVHPDMDDTGPAVEVPGLWIRTMHRKANLSVANCGTACTLWLRLHVGVGQQLALRFGRSGGPIPLNSLEVYANESAPLEFDRSRLELAVTDPLAACRGRTQRR